MVPSFGLEQAIVKVGEFTILNVSAEQIESFTRTGFDETGDQESVDCPSRFIFFHQIRESASVGAWDQPSEADSTPIEQLSDELEMGQFFVHDFGHRAAQVGVFHIGEHEVQRGASRLLLAVGMVDQNVRQVPVDLVEPPPRRLRL
jgi:hypothetical protein